MSGRPVEVTDVKLGRLGSEIGFLLRIAQVRVYDQYFAQLGQNQLKPGEFSILWAIAANPSIRQSLLCERLLVKRSHMTKLIRGLEDRGFVSRRIPDDDRRSVELEITPEGQDFIDQHATWFFRFEDSLGDVFSPEERAVFIGLLRKFARFDMGDTAL